MAKAPFRTYLHGNGSSYELAEELSESLQKQGIDIDLETILSTWENNGHGRPFYEITLDCEVDLDTFEITLLKAH